MQMRVCVCVCVCVSAHVSVKSRSKKCLRDDDDGELRWRGTAPHIVKNICPKHFTMQHHVPTQYKSDTSNKVCMHAIKCRLSRIFTQTFY